MIMSGFSVSIMKCCFSNILCLYILWIMNFMLRIQCWSWRGNCWREWADVCIVCVAMLCCVSGLCCSCGLFVYIVSVHETLVQPLTVNYKWNLNTHMSALVLDLTFRQIIFSAAACCNWTIWNAVLMPAVLYEVPSRSTSFPPRNMVNISRHATLNSLLWDRS